MRYVNEQVVMRIVLLPIPFHHNLARCSVPALLVLTYGCSDDGVAPVPQPIEAGVHASVDAGPDAASSASPTDVTSSSRGQSSSMSVETSATFSNEAGASQSTETDSSSLVEAGTGTTDPTSDIATESATGETSTASPSSSVHDTSETGTSLPPIDWSEPPLGVTCADPSNCVDKARGLDLDYFDSCAIKADGTVWCWGSFNGWEDGDDHPTPELVTGLTGVVSLSSHATTRCALKADGTVWCWGESISPVFGPDVEVTEADYYGYYYTLYSAPEPVQKPELDHVKSVVIGWGHMCALEDDGSVWCWGDGTYGQLGDGTTDVRDTPVRVEGLPQVRHIAATDNTTCVVTVAGDVFCWGTNVSGELGDGSAPAGPPYYEFTSSDVPLQVAGLQDVVALEAGSFNFCAITAEQEVKCWGGLSGSSLNEVDTSSPVAIDFWAGAKDVAPGYSHACAVLSDGRISCIGDYRFGETGAVTRDATTPVFVEGIDDAVMVSVGDYLSCAVRASGEVLCWGDDSSGQLGDGTVGLAESAVPLAVASDDAFSAVAAADSVCGLQTNGELSCWGSNFNGELGVDPSILVASATPVDGPDLPGIVTLSGGEGHFCALLDDASVSCWGDNTFGQLGDPLITDLSSAMPIQVAELSGVTALDSSFNFSCALLDGGTVSCWGDNSYGQLGLDPEEVPFSAVATPVPDVTDAIDVAAGPYHVCARRSDASVMCWGGNYFSQFGPNTSDPALPMIVPAFEGAKAIGTETGVTCLVNSDDTVSCTKWAPTATDAGVENDPVLVEGLSNVASITPRCGLRHDGSIACWAEDWVEPPADGGALPLTEFLELGPASQLSGRGTKCAVLSGDSSIVCWGSNWNGNLGTGATRWRSNPEPVAWPN